jgi:GNAT superfamily N-acetyltransferase
VAQLGHLTHDDVEQAEALSAGIGWNQTADDWARMLALAPDGVFGAFEAGRLVATSSVVAYGGALAWIGMMIVAEGHRGLGLGKRLLDAALASPTLPPGATLGLDATDLGAPLYRGRGFVDVEPIDRWGGVLQASTAPEGTAVRPVGAADVAALADWDAERTRVDRRTLVAHMLQASGAGAWIATRDGDLVGYAAVRPGRTHRHLGPLLAEDDDALDALFSAAAEGLAGASVFADVVRSPASDAAFARAGLSVARRLTRMTRTHPKRVLSGTPVWATAGLEWG